MFVQVEGILFYIAVTMNSVNRLIGFVRFEIVYFVEEVDSES